MKFIIEKSRDPAYNLALEEYVLSNCRDDDYFILWINEPSIIVGKFQNVYQEIDVKEAFLKNIPVYRRNSGGGCVYHDEGNLNFSFITDWKMEENTYSRFLDTIIRILRENGIPAHQSGICNLSIDDKKISGNAQTIYKKRILHHGTLLFDTKLDVIRKILRPDYKHYVSKAMQSVNMPVMNIKEYGSGIRTMEELKLCLLEAMGYKEKKRFELSREERKCVEELKRTKYCSWEWNYAKMADFDYLHYYHKPMASLKYHVENGILEEMAIWHQNIPVAECGAIAKKLLQKRFVYSEIHNVLMECKEYGEIVENLMFDNE